MSSANSRQSKTTQVRCLCASTLLPSAQSAQVYWITLTSQHTLTHLLRKKLRDREAKPSFNLHQLKRICLPRVHREKESEAGRQREGTSFLKKNKNLWIGVWICMRERKLCSPVEWRQGSGASFCLPDLQMALWTQVSTRDVKECQWDPPPLPPLLTHSFLV